MLSVPRRSVLTCGLKDTEAMTAFKGGEDYNHGPSEAHTDV